MRALAGTGGILLVAIILWDAFATIVLPRRASTNIRVTRLFYLATWLPTAALARRIQIRSRRESVLSLYGPLSLLLLILVWLTVLIVAFALLLWALARPGFADGTSLGDFGTSLYMSGTTLFTLGLGDVTPHTGIGRLLTVIEVGLGFSFLALVISYLPVFYGAFSERERNISMLDARAGSPPTALGFLIRHGDNKAAIEDFLLEWERWCANLMESLISYPQLAFFRSQHDNQSWVAALTMMLDVSALILAGIEGIPNSTAQFTLAIARHAAVDLSQIFTTGPLPPADDRLPAEDLQRLFATLEQAGITLYDDPEREELLAEARALYEPYVNALAQRFLSPLPPWLPLEDSLDNWLATAGDGNKPSPFRRRLDASMRRRRS